MFHFKITAQDGNARVGELETPHGVIQTPVFMPVGTHGAVKGVSPAELTETGSQIILGNTYHLYLRPGDELIAKLGGLHEFMQWKGPILTDSGGFQVFSLGERGMTGSEKKALRKVSEEGIEFQSHLDGSKHMFTPEKSIQVQQNLGADIIMAFDQPVYGLTVEKEAAVAMRRSMRWLERSKTAWTNREKQALFGIVQGGTYTKLHQESAEFVAAQDLPGNALGGLSVGEGKAEMWAATESITSLLPKEKPRYFMGLGDPLDLIEATIRGVDMYDCVAPSRLARHGVIWMPVGEGAEAFLAGEPVVKPVQFERWNLKNARFKDDSRTLAGFSYAALSHYIKTNEMLGFRILTMHNIQILHRITLSLRRAIEAENLQNLLSHYFPN